MGKSVRGSLRDFCFLVSSTLAPLVLCHGTVWPKGYQLTLRHSVCLMASSGCDSYNLTEFFGSNFILFIYI